MRFAIAIVCAISQGLAFGQTGKSAGGSIVFYPVADLGQSGFGPKLLGGQEAVAAEWPATFYTLRPETCTATLVGHRVVLLAAHCLAGGASIAIEFLDGRSILAACQTAPEYENEKSADYALCKLNGDISDAPYEVINTNPSLLQVGKDIVLGGFGCTQSIGVGGNDGIYRIGTATIKSLPGSNGSTPNFLEAEGGVALCLGDSGGGAYITGSGGKTRQLVAVNARGNYSTISYLASTSTSIAREFWRKWSESNDATICGVSAAAVNCR